MAMTEFEVVGKPAVIPHGMVRLTDKQAARRAHLLKAGRGRGMYEVMQPIQFKVGERFAWDGEVEKSMREVIVEADALDEQRAEHQRAAERTHAEQESKRQRRRQGGADNPEQTSDLLSAADDAGADEETGSDAEEDTHG